MLENAQSYAINTYSYIMSHSARDCMAHLGQSGFREFELMAYPGHLWPDDMDAAARRDLRRFIAESGFGVLTLNMPNIDVNIAAAAPGMRAYSIGLLHAILELAGDLEVPAVIIGPGKHNPLFPEPAERLKPRFFAALDALLPVAERAGTQIVVENMPFAFLSDAENLMAAIEDYGADEIGVVYDVANGAFIGADLGAEMDRAWPRTYLVHVSDTTRAVYRHDPIGRGDIDFAAVAGHLKRLGYGGAPMLEIISTEPDADLADSVRRLSAMGWDAIGRG